MQVTETLSQGLKREYDISLPASDLAAKLNGQLADLKAKVRINGFRPGKVPVEHLRKVYGKSVMADVVQEAIASANKKIIDDNHLRLAREPKVELPSDQAAIDAALEARGDLNFKVALEVLPVFEIGDFSQISLDRLTADVEPSDVETALDRLAEERRSYSEKPPGARAEIHDRVTIDFDGTIEGVPFEGGEGRDIQVALGSNTFLPGFEDQLLGVVVGDKRAVRATFPEAYAVRALAGKTADFDATVKAVAARDPFPLDDEFAKSMGSETSTNSRRRCAIGSLPSTRASRAIRLSASSSISSTNFIRSSCRKGWSIKSSILFGSKSLANSRPLGGPSPMRTRRKRPRRPTIVRSLKGGCAWGFCWPKSGRGRR